MRRFVATGHLNGVPVFIHWTLLVPCGVLMLGAFRSVAYVVAAGAAIIAYFSAMLLHEWGHVTLARRRGYQVYGIQFYPLVGLTRIEHPRTRFDHCVIAWGGVLFQGAVGIPVLVWIILVGYTPVEPVNAFLAVFGYLTLVMLPLNLAPVPPLDGAVAWGIVPLLVRRMREKRSRASPGWKSAR